MRKPPCRTAREVFIHLDAEGDLRTLDVDTVGFMPTTDGLMELT
jgi:hypothetical protein